MAAFAREVVPAELELPCGLLGYADRRDVRPTHSNISNATSFVTVSDLSPSPTTCMCGRSDAHRAQSLRIIGDFIRYNGRQSPGVPGNGERPVQRLPI
jgi:hypothetical protein